MNWWRRLLVLLQRRKDAWLSLAALASPFVAAAVGIYSADRAARSTQLVINANVGISYREKLADALRDNLAEHRANLTNLWSELGDDQKMQEIGRQESLSMAKIDYLASNSKDWLHYADTRDHALETLRNRKHKDQTKFDQEMRETLVKLLVAGADMVTEVLNDKTRDPH